MQGDVRNRKKKIERGRAGSWIVALFLRCRNGFLVTYGVDSETANVDEDVVGE